MSTKDVINIAVKIFGREYSIKCKASEESILREAVEFLDDEMKKTSSMNHVINTEQVAVLTALNLSNQLLTLKNTEQKALAHDALQDRLQTLLHRLKTSLANFAEITV
jgi:cell division protein ZapA